MPHEQLDLFADPVAARAEFLRKEIARHDRLYYVEARPEIGDADYDALYRELEAIEKSFPALDTPTSPTHRVGGAPINEFLPVRHEPPMMSLEKVHTREDLADFENFIRRVVPQITCDYIVEPKIDGVAFSLLYERGKLVRAATRGNGEVGDDITANVRTIRAIPLTIPTDAETVELRGEVYMTKEGFLELTKQQEAAGDEPFANPRNAAAGSIKLLDPREVARRPLAAIIYATGALDGIAFETHEEMTREVAAWGFPTTPRAWKCANMTDVMTALDELETLRHSFPFEMDGAVLKVNERHWYEELGATAKSPRWARAFKFEPERTQTILRGITVQVGRSGVLTPVAELEPVRLAGSLISRATLHNADEIERKDIRIGDTVNLVKAGDVIPAIESVVNEKRCGSERVFVMPAACPACGKPVVRNEGEVAHRCQNPACPARIVARIEHFASRGALDIDGIGDKFAEAITISDPLDLFSWSAEDFARLELGDTSGNGRTYTLGDKIAARISAALEHSRTLPLARWLFALGIPSIGETVAQQIAAHHADWKSLVGSQIMRDIATHFRLVPLKKSELGEERFAQAEAIADSLLERGVAKLAKRTGKDYPRKIVYAIKPEAAREWLAFEASDWGRATIARLEELGINPQGEAQISGGVLAGESFVITGTMSATRDEIAALIRANGGRILDAVSKNVSFVAAGDSPGASKIKKAQALGIPIISENDLRERIANQ